MTTHKKQKFTSSWKTSTQPRKQRKYLARAPLHHKQKMVHVHLAKLLREKHGVRSTQVRKGDKVKILRGEFRGKEGKVGRVSLRSSRVYVTGIERIKADSTKIAVALVPSNLMIMELDLADNFRKEKLSAAKHSAKKLSAKGEASKTVLSKGEVSKP